MDALHASENEMNDVYAEIERLIRRDPARRGLIGDGTDATALCVGHLRAAAEDLARTAKSVGIVTGFFVPKAELPAAETDGPPGSVMLAAVLDALGVAATIFTDERCHSAVAAAASAAGLPADAVQSIGPNREFSNESNCGDWAKRFWGNKTRSITHLIAVERVGPCHTTDSLSRQRRTGDVPHADFARLVAASSHNCCHNMRGECIDNETLPLHHLFDERPSHLKTIGIGDGGNEIGMGAIPWEEICRRLDDERVAHIPCRVATDWAIVAGTSNWGACALAAAVAVQKKRVELLREWTSERHHNVLTAMVERGPAVDGISRKRQPTVDGIPFLTYMQPLEGIRRAVGL